MVLALLDPATAGDRWPVVALTALAAGWHLAFQRLGLTDQQPRLALVYLVGLLSVWFVLAGLHPVYFSLLLVLYPQVFRYLRLPLAIPASVALTVEVVWREILASGRPPSENLPAVAGGLVSVIFGSLFAFWLTRIIDQSYERRRLIEQLEATRSELAAAERERGRLAERQRLARDIHDTLAQGFVSIVLQLQAAEAELPDGAAEAAATWSGPGGRPPTTWPRPGGWSGTCGRPSCGRPRWARPWAGWPAGWPRRPAWSPPPP
jgi:signal transduction histidine kinase